MINLRRPAGSSRASSPGSDSSARVHGERGHKVHGLTTAATVWVSAVAGILCGLGAWRVATIVTVLVGVVLLAGGPIEKLLVRRYVSDVEGEHPDSQKGATSEP